MATLRDLNRRIRSVKNTQQITKAMEMVAAAKLRKAQDKVGAAAPYADKLAEVLRLLSSSEAAGEHPFFEKRSGSREAIVVVTSDRGLCGAFNATICREVEHYVGTRDRSEIQLVTVGKKAYQYFSRRGWTISETFTAFGDQVDFALVQKITRIGVDLFTSREVDRVTIVATQFVSASRRHVVASPFLPVVSPEGDGSSVNRNYIFEPSEEEIFAELLPRFTNALFYSVLAGSFAAEHAARMIAMGNATRNAGDLIDSLTLTRNRLRQAAITSELADIVGAVEALA